MRADFVLIPRVLIDMGRDEHRVAFLARGQGNRAEHLGTRAFRRFDDLLRRDVDQAMIERLQADANALPLTQNPSSSDPVPPAALPAA